jgi:hypothetical protein
VFGFDRHVNRVDLCVVDDAAPRPASGSDLWRDRGAREGFLRASD